jgi:hypothetical protein
MKNISETYDVIAPSSSCAAIYLFLPPLPVFFFLDFFPFPLFSVLLAADTKSASKAFDLPL